MIDFINKLKQSNINAALAKAGAIRGKSRKKIYQELGLESFQNRHCYRKAFPFSRLFTLTVPEKLKNTILGIPLIPQTLNINN